MIEEMRQRNADWISGFYKTRDWEFSVWRKPWIKNLTAVALVAAGAQVGSLARCSGLKIWYCHSCASASIPGPGTSICSGCGHKNKPTNLERLFWGSWGNWNKDHIVEFPCGAVG